MGETFETVTVGVSTFDSPKIQEEITSAITTDKVLKMGKEFNTETAIDSVEPDVAEKEASKLSPVTKSRTSSTSSGSSKKEMIATVKLTKTSTENKLEKGLTAPEIEDKKIESKEDIQTVQKR